MEQFTENVTVNQKYFFRTTLFSLKLEYIPKIVFKTIFWPFFAFLAHILDFFGPIVHILRFLVHTYPCPTYMYKLKK